MKAISNTTEKKTHNESCCRQTLVWLQLQATKCDDSEKKTHVKQLTPSLMQIHWNHNEVKFYYKTINTVLSLIKKNSIPGL